MQIATPLSTELGHYLDLATQRLGLISGNMANVDTPGYHTRDMDFRKAFQAARAAACPAHASPEEVGGLVERPDGNNVSVDRESMAMAEVQLQFRTGSALLKREFQKISDAIKDDK